MINKPPSFSRAKKIGSLIQSQKRGGGLKIRGLGFITCLGLRVQDMHPCLYGGWGAFLGVLAIWIVAHGVYVGGPICMENAIW